MVNPDRSLRVMVLSGLCPSRDNLLGGVFITRRLLALERLGIPFAAYDVRVYYNPLRRFASNALKKLAGKSGKARGKKEASESLGVMGASFTGIPVADSVFRKANDDAVVREIARVLVSGQYTLLHAHPTYPEGVWAVEAGRLAKVPVILTAHGGDIQTVPVQKPEAKQVLVDALEAADAVIFVSSALRDEARGMGYSAKNAEVIPNGYDEKTFYKRDKANARNGLGLDPEKKVIGFVGDLVSVKRADQLPQIFRVIAGKLKDAIFVIIGRGPLECEIRDACEGLNVIMTGQLAQEAVARWMSAFDALILPSRREGWGCVIKEAQACGTPCVGTRTGGIPEAVGEAGCLVAESDKFEESFAETVVDLVTHPIAGDVVAKGAEGFSWMDTVTREVALYSRLAERCKEHA